MIHQVCAICEKNNFMVLYPENFDVKQINSRIFSARRLPDRVHYRIVQCKSCGLVYSTPILEYKKLEKLYKKSFTSYDEHLENLKETYGYYLRELKEKYQKQTVDGRRLRLDKESRSLRMEKNDLTSSFKRQDLASSFQPPASRLLEIGCGNGFFLEEAKEQGYEIYGIEPGEKSVKKARKDIRPYITIDIFKPNLFKRNFFDVICCFQTFDHIPDPNGLLREAYKMLKKGGLMLFFNHDVGAWQNKLMAEKSPIIDIEHTYLFDKKTMSKIFEKHKFKILEVKSAFNIHNLSYWLHLFPIPNTIKISLIKFLDKMGLGKFKLKLNPGNLVLFAKK